MASAAVADGGSRDSDDRRSGSVTASQSPKQKKKSSILSGGRMKEELSLFSETVVKAIAESLAHGSDNEKIEAAKSISKLASVEDEIGIKRKQYILGRIGMPHLLVAMLRYSLERDKNGVPKKTESSLMPMLWGNKKKKASNIDVIGLKDSCRLSALDALIQLANGNDKLQNKINEAGGISIILSLLRSLSMKDANDTSLTIVSVAANFLVVMASGNQQTQKTMVKEGAIPLLVSLLRGVSPSKFSVTPREENPSRILSANNAATVLGILAQNIDTVHEEMRQAGVVSALVSMIQYATNFSGTNTNNSFITAANALNSLANGSPENKDRIVKAGAVPVLLKALEHADENCRTCARNALLMLERSNLSNQALILMARSVPRVLKLFAHVGEEDKRRQLSEDELQDLLSIAMHELAYPATVATERPAVDGSATDAQPQRDAAYDRVQPQRLRWQHYSRFGASIATLGLSALQRSSLVAMNSALNGKRSLFRSPKSPRTCSRSSLPSPSGGVVFAAKSSCVEASAGFESPLVFSHAGEEVPSAGVAAVIIQSGNDGALQSDTGEFDARAAKVLLGEPGRASLAAGDGTGESEGSIEFPDLELLISALCHGTPQEKAIAADALCALARRSESVISAAQDSAEPWMQGDSTGQLGEVKEVSESVSVSEAVETTKNIETTRIDFEPQLQALDARDKMDSAEILDALARGDGIPSLVSLLCSLGPPTPTPTLTHTPASAQTDGNVYLFDIASETEPDAPSSPSPPPRTTLFAAPSKDKGAAITVAAAATAAAGAAAELLALLGARSDDNKRAIAASGAIPLLVGLMCQRQQRQRHPSFSRTGGDEGSRGPPYSKEKDNIWPDEASAAGVVEFERVVCVDVQGSAVLALAQLAEISEYAESIVSFAAAIPSLVEFIKRLQLKRSERSPAPAALSAAEGKDRGEEAGEKEGSEERISVINLRRNIYDHVMQQAMNLLRLLSLFDPEYRTITSSFGALPVLIARLASLAGACHVETVLGRMQELLEVHSQLHQQLDDVHKRRTAVALGVIPLLLSALLPTIIIDPNTSFLRREYDRVGGNGGTDALDVAVRGMRQRVTLVALESLLKIGRNNADCCAAIFHAEGVSRISSHLYAARVDAAAGASAGGADGGGDGGGDGVGSGEGGAVRSEQGNSETAVRDEQNGGLLSVKDTADCVAAIAARILTMLISFGGQQVRRACSDATVGSRLIAQLSSSSTECLIHASRALVELGTEYLLDMHTTAAATTTTAEAAAAAAAAAAAVLPILVANPRPLQQQEEKKSAQQIRLVSGPAARSNPIVHTGSDTTILSADINGHSAHCPSSQGEGEDRDNEPASLEGKEIDRGSYKAGGEKSNKTGENGTSGSTKFADIDQLKRKMAAVRVLQMLLHVSEEGKTATLDSRNVANKDVVTSLFSMLDTLLLERKPIEGQKGVRLEECAWEEQQHQKATDSNPPPPLPSTDYIPPPASEFGSCGCGYGRRCGCSARALADVVGTIKNLVFCVDRRAAVLLTEMRAIPQLLRVLQRHPGGGEKISGEEGKKSVHCEGEINGYCDEVCGGDSDPWDPDAAAAASAAEGTRDGAGWDAATAACVCARANAAGALCMLSDSLTNEVVHEAELKASILRADPIPFLVSLLRLAPSPPPSGSTPPTTIPTLTSSRSCLSPASSEPDLTKRFPSTPTAALPTPSTLRGSGVVSLLFSKRCVAECQGTAAAVLWEILSSNNSRFAAQSVHGSVMETAGLAGALTDLLLLLRNENTKIGSETTTPHEVEKKLPANSGRLDPQLARNGTGGSSSGLLDLCSHVEGNAVRLLYKLVLISNDKIEMKAQIVEAGLIQVLISLCSAGEGAGGRKGGNRIAKENAVSLLRTLSAVSEHYRSLITQGGAIQPLVSLLDDGSTVARQFAVFTLISFAEGDANARAHIGDRLQAMRPLSREDFSQKCFWDNYRHLVTQCPPSSCYTESI